MIGSEAQRRNFGLKLGRQLRGRIGARLEQFGDQAVSPIALAGGFAAHYTLLTLGVMH